MKRDEVLVAIYGSKLWKEIKKDFVAEAKKVKTLQSQSEFLAKWNYYYMFETPLSTIKGRGLEMRKALKGAGLKEDNPLFDFFKVETNLYKIMNKKADDKVVQNLEDGIKNDFNYVKTVDEILKNLIESINSNEIESASNNTRKSRELAYQKLFVLAVATGRRQIELMKLLELQKKKDLVLYKNLAKKKESDNDSIIAPILIDVNLAKKFLRDIKEEFKTENMTNKEVNSKFNGSVAKALHRYLPDEVAKNGFHFLRTLYAEYCFEKFSDKKDKNMYFSQILGHDFKPNAAHNYQAKV